MDSNDNFYVFLPSNSSSQYFPENTHSNYKVQLPKPIELNGNFEVALVQSFFLSNWYNIVNDDGNIILQQNPATNKHIKLKEGYYNSAESLVQEINSEIMNMFGYKYIHTHENSKEIPLEKVFSKLKQTLQTRSDINKSQSEFTKLRDEINNLKNELQKAYGVLTSVDNEIVALNKVAAGENRGKSKKELEVLAKLENKKTSAKIFYEAIKSRLENAEKSYKIKSSEVNQFQLKYEEDVKWQEDFEKDFLIEGQTNIFPKLILSPVTRKVTIFLPSKTGLHFSKTLQRMLGFEPTGEMYHNKTENDMYIDSKLKADLTTDLNSIYIYCNIIESQYVADSLVPLLRIVHLTDSDGVRVTKNFQHPFYMPVSQRHINVIEIDIRDAYGRAIHFSSGDVVLNILHFRRQRVT